MGGPGRKRRVVGRIEEEEEIKRGERVTKVDVREEVVRTPEEKERQMEMKRRKEERDREKERERKEKEAKRWWKWW
jgi:hypothetical protein